MASDMAASPRQLLASPTRRPLQNLNPNLNITPRRLASGKASSNSPVKTNTTQLTPAVLLSTKKPSVYKSTETMILNPSKKRPIDDVIAEGRDQTRASFSSMINFDPSSDDAEPTSSATIADECVYRSRADVLKLRLQMAMFRVRTNQLQTPFAQLQVPADPPAPVAPQPAGELQSIAAPTTPPTRIRSDSNSSIEDNITLNESNALHDQQRRISPGRKEDSSSLVQDDAISGLLELRRGT